jgi:hypothetical protein
MSGVALLGDWSGGAQNMEAKFYDPWRKKQERNVGASESVPTAREMATLRLVEEIVILRGIFT